MNGGCQRGKASISVFYRVLCRREECEIGIFPFATRLPHEIDESSRNSNFLVFHPLKFPHSPFFFLHVAAFSRRGKRMMLITELFPFFLIQFLLPKSPLRYPSPLNSLSVEQKSLFMFPKILRLFQFRRARSLSPSLPLCPPLSSFL